MPGGRHERSGFFDQHVVMEETCRARTHHAGGDFTCTAFPDHHFELRDTGPVAIIVEETTFTVLDSVFRGIGTGVFKIPGYPGFNRLDPVVEDSSQEDGAVAVIGPDQFVSYHLERLHSGGPTSICRAGGVPSSGQDAHRRHSCRA